MREDDLDALVAVERAGTRRLAEHGFPSLLDVMVDADGMRALTEGRGVWVAAGDADAPVGFAVASDEGRFMYLHELSVVPPHHGRGIGTMLLGAVVDHARWAFHTVLALDTFRTVPFNAPFYAKRGFMALERKDVPPEIEALAAAGRPPGIHPGARVVMVRRL